TQTTTSTSSSASSLSSTSSASTSTQSTTASTTSILPLVFNSLTSSNSVPIQGQTETITATVSGGLPPYTFDFTAKNLTSSNVIFFTSVSNSLTSNSVGFALPAEANDLGAIAINVVISDSANSLPVSGNTVISVSANAVNATTANSSITPISSGSSTNITPITTAQSGINTAFVSGLLTSYASGLVNGASTAQFNGTSALNNSQLILITSKLRGVKVNLVRVNVSYGSLSQDGKLQGAGKTLYYVQYNGNNIVTEYAVNVIKRVPDLHVKIGNFTTNSAMGNVTLLQSVYTPAIVNGVPHLYPQGTYSINPKIFSSTLNNNTLNYTYSIYTGSTLRAHGTASGSGIGKGFGFSGISVSQPTKIVFDAQGNSNYSSIDPTVYVFYSSSNINVNPPTGTVLSGDLICGSLTVSSGNTLNTVGYSILCNSTIANSGTIYTSISGYTPNNGGTGAGGGGTNEASSYGGGGGGGSGGAGSNGGAGGPTPTPTITNANIQTWYGGGGLAIQTYFEGAGGGADAQGDSGGAGGYGLYMQASNIIAGTISAVGVYGATSSTTISKTAGGAGGYTSNNLNGGSAGAGANGKATTGGSGGGGGGFVLLAYSTTAPSTASVSVAGGTGGAGAQSGGNGGAGNAQVYGYGTSAPIVVLQQLNIQPATIGSAILDVGQAYTFSTTAFNGLSPYTGNWQWIAPNTVSSTNTITTSLPTATNALSLTLSPLSDTDLQYTWSGTNYQVTTSSTTIEGLWAFNGFVVDNSLDTSTGNTVNTANTPQITINTKPAATLTPSSSSPGPSTLETYTIGVNGGTGQFTAELYNVSGSKQACADGKTPPCNVIITSPGGSNTIAFTVGTSGSYTYNAIVTDLGTTNPYTFNSIQNTITISSATCVPTISNTLITFPTTKAGFFAPTANVETVTDSGTAATYIYLYSLSDSNTGNWVSGGNKFGVSNTLWNPTSDGSSNMPANALTNSISTNTLLYVSPTVSNTIYFGVNIPKGQPAGTYAQGITVSLSC
ncbi:MAG: hypothetical protein M1286_01780, partial [Candidatus Marsarchaeota archaeon]|nr:hypothetical protein [Candidatus Marsarchaeota archaeon]